MSMMYILDDNGNPVPENDFVTWSDKFDISNRIIARDEVNDVLISTVFSGVDHSYVSGSDPVLFETIIFGGEYDGYQARYTTRENALKGHAEAVMNVM